MALGAQQKRIVTGSFRARCIRGARYSHRRTIPEPEGASSPPARLPGISGQEERYRFVKTRFSPQISALPGRCFTTTAASCCRARLGRAAARQGTSPGWAGTKHSSNTRSRPQRTKNAPEHRQNPAASRRPPRNGISERAVSALLKQSHCGRGRILINSFLSLISIFPRFPFQLLR